MWRHLSAPRGLFGAVTKTQLSQCVAGGSSLFPLSDLSHQSASYCTYCSHCHSSDPAEWVRMQLGDDVWKKPQMPVMSLYVRTVISSRCKCILVQVGPLIYSSKCNFINLSLISLSTHCKSQPEKKWGEEMSTMKCSSVSSKKGKTWERKGISSSLQIRGWEAVWPV